MERRTEGMSLGEESRSHRPAQPTGFTVLPTRPAPPPPTATKPKAPTPPIKPVYRSVPTDATPGKTGNPLRPVPPVRQRPVLSRGQCFSQSTETEDCPGNEESSDRRNTGNSWNKLSTEGTEAYPLYEDVLPNENNPNDNTTTPASPPFHRRPPAPPRPIPCPRPALVPPGRPFHSISEEPEHLYEDIDKLLSETLPDDDSVNGEGVCAAGRKSVILHPVRALSEQSSVNGDNSEKELDVLLEWFGNVEEWKKLPMDHPTEELESKLLSVAHRVKMAMRLYQLLVFHRGQRLLKHITDLHCTADSLSRTGKNTRIAGITGGTTGAVGAAAVVAGIALAPFTLGASLVAAGIGVGVAAAGGVTGASAAITNKVKNNKVRSKVEKILKNYRYHMETIVECLEFFDGGLELIRHNVTPRLKHQDTDILKISQIAQGTGSLCSSEAISECSCILQGFASGLDSYFSEEDKLKLKKGSESQFAEKIRELADKLKESMDELIHIRNLFRSVIDNA